MSLEPDESIAVITRSEAFLFLPFVLKYALLQITRYAGVKRMATAGHDVCEIGALVHALILSGNGASRCDEEQPRILPLHFVQRQDDSSLG
jgi:hypothetical protein